MVARTTLYRAFFLHCPMISAKSIFFDACTANQRYRFDLLRGRCRPSPLHAYKWGPCPLSGQWLYLQDLINPALHLPMKIPKTNIQKAPFHLSHIYVGGGMLFNHLKYNEVVWIGNTCVHIPDGGLRCVTWNTRGLIGSLTSCSQLSREQKKIYFRRLIENNNIICLQDVHGKDEFLQAIQILAPRFRLYGALKRDNANAGGSAICIHKDIT